MLLNDVPCLGVLCCASGKLCCSAAVTVVIIAQVATGAPGLAAADFTAGSLFYSSSSFLYPAFAAARCCAFYFCFDLVWCEVLAMRYAAAAVAHVFRVLSLFRLGCLHTQRTPLGCACAEAACATV
jgi:hypothetical protein